MSDLYYSPLFRFTRSPKALSTASGCRHPKVINQRSGTHHIYANPCAIEDYKTGNFHDGAVIVFDELEIKTEDGAEDLRKAEG